MLTTEDVTHTHQVVAPSLWSLYSPGQVGLWSEVDTELLPPTQTGNTLGRMHEDRFACTNLCLQTEI